MSDKLDAELTRAAGLAEPEPAGAEPPATPPETAAVVAVTGTEPEPSARRRLGLLLALLVLVAATVVLFLVGFKEAAIYALSVDELVSRADELAGRRVRIDGELVPGTLRKRDKPCEYRFWLGSKAQRLEVRYPQCVVPPNLRDEPSGGVLVTVEGRLTEQGFFEASDVMAKCSSRYDPATRTMRDAG